MQLATVDIPITDQFDNSRGEWHNYDCVPVAHRGQIFHQQHVDIRCFDHETTTRSSRMFDLDGQALTDLDADTLTSLEQHVLTLYDEAWSTGTIGPWSSYNNWRGLRFTLSSGVPQTATSVMAPVDLWTTFDDTDLFSMAMPTFPASSLNLAQCNVTLTSSTGDTSVHAFSTSAVSLVTGHSEFRLPRSALFVAAADREAALSGVTTVSITLTPTGNCTVYIMAIRLLATTWDYALSDFNTLRQRIVKPVSRNGNPAAAYDFPTQTDFSDLPADWPILFRSDEPSSSDDPRPVDLGVTSVFAAGSLTHSNQISWYFREFSLDENTMLDLGGVPMGVLDAAHTLPDYGTARYTSRTQTDLDQDGQQDLDGQTQFDLERLSDYTAEAFIEMRLQFSSSATTLSILDANGDGYILSGLPILTASSGGNPTYYIARLDVEDNTVQLRLYQVGTNDSLTLIYDSTAITDEGAFKRRRGRFGFRTAFGDGDAFLDHIRSRSIVHGEMITSELSSLTPVDGLQLLAGASADQELLETFVPTDTYTTITAARDKSKSGKAYRIKSLARFHAQGLRTNTFTLTDLPETRITFDYFFPSYAQPASGQALETYLYDPARDRYIWINMGAVLFDRWEHASVSLGDLTTDASEYQLLLIQPCATVTAEWYIDNLSINARTVSWDARGQRPDPWGMSGDQWIPLRSTVNKQQGGVLFFERGKGIQVRGRARRATAYLQDIKIIPKYSELGRFAWLDEHVPPATTDPASEFSYVGDPTTKIVQFDASTSFSPNGPIIYAYWNFGDGATDVGTYVTHIYAATGTYHASLTVVDSQLQMATFYGDVIL